MGLLQRVSPISAGHSGNSHVPLDFEKRYASTLLTGAGADTAWGATLHGICRST